MSEKSLFAQKFLEECQKYFATLYRRVSEKFWNNSVYSYVKAAYYTCNFDVGLAEYYVPTVLNGENFMQFYGITVAVLPELDEDIYNREIERLVIPSSRPMGFLDSRTVFVVAPEVTRKHAYKVWKEKTKAMLKIRKVAGWLFIPIVSNVPEIAFKKLLRHVVNFWRARVKGFLRKLNVEPWQYDYKERNILSLLPKVIENYCCQIIYCLRSMVAHLCYFEDAYREVMGDIGRLNMLMDVVRAGARRLVEALNVLSERDRAAVVEQMEKCLAFVQTIIDGG